MKHSSKIKINQLLDDEIFHMTEVYNRTQSNYWLEEINELKEIKEDVNVPSETIQSAREGAFFYGSLIGMLAGITIGFLMWS